MISSRSNGVLNIVKRLGANGGGSLNRSFGDFQDYNWFTSTSTINQTSSLFLLNSKISVNSINRLFCELKTVNCWNCGSIIDNKDNTSISCSDCTAPQLNDQRRNYYNLFDQPITYDVDVHQIRQKYLNLQRILHPDKFINRPQEDQQISSELSTYVNKGYRILINPYERGIYLLKLEGIHREESSGNYIMEPEFLEHMIIINEAVLESGTQDLQKIREEIELKVNKLVESVSIGFQSNQLEQVELSLNKLKFYVNILDKIIQKE